jgi:hypothetical protein
VSGLGPALADYAAKEALRWLIGVGIVCGCIGGLLVWFAT